MSRRLQWVNFTGTLLLAGCCVFQWQHDRQLNQALVANEKIRQTQEHQLTENATNLRNLTEDLEHFKNDYFIAHTNAIQLQEKVQVLERENTQLTLDGEQLKASITNWSAAVTLRDARLTEANARLRELSSQLTEAVLKYNTLATNYEALRTALNNARTAKAPQ